MSRVSLFVDRFISYKASYSLMVAVGLYIGGPYHDCMAGKHRAMAQKSVCTVQANKLEEMACEEELTGDLLRMGGLGVALYGLVRYRFKREEQGSKKP